MSTLKRPEPVNEPLFVIGCRGIMAPPSVMLGPERERTSRPPSEIDIFLCVVNFEILQYAEGKMTKWRLNLVKIEDR